MVMHGDAWVAQSKVEDTVGDVVSGVVIHSISIGNGLNVNDGDGGCVGGPSVDKWKIL